MHACGESRIWAIWRGSTGETLRCEIQYKPGHLPESLILGREHAARVTRLTPKPNPGDQCPYFCNLDDSGRESTLRRRRGHERQTELRRTCRHDHYQSWGSPSAQDWPNEGTTVEENFLPRDPPAAAHPPESTSHSETVKLSLEEVNPPR